MNIPNTPRATILAAVFALVSTTLATNVFVAQTGGGTNRNGGGIGGYCGDSMVQSEHGEECDEGGVNTSDCTENCMIPDDRELCGNNNVDEDEDEECDEGSNNGEEGVDCSKDCKYKDPYGGGGNNGWNNNGGGYEVCGDGITEGYEECDDGNGNNTDKCTRDCYKAVCGDGYTQPSNDETCDNGSRNGTAGDHCRKDCTLHPVCGNDVKEDGEECDDGNDENSDKCTNRCKEARCGDGILHKGEEMCDSGKENGFASSNCTKDCKKRPICGNNVKEDGEECDDGNDKNSDKCTNRCKEAKCGDGIVHNDHEVCDEGTKNGTSESGCSKECKKIEEQNDDDYDDDKGSNTSINNQPENPNKPTVKPAAPKPNDDNKEKERIEELRQKRKEIEERIAAQKKIDRENAQNQKDAVQARRDEAKERKSELLCYNASGELTDDRSLCDTNQSQFVRGGDVDDTTAKEILRKKFQGDDAAEKHRANLLTTMQNSRVRLGGLLESNGHRDEVTAYLKQSIEWLDRGITYFSEGPKDTQEIQQMVGPVKQLLTQAKILIQEEKELPSEPVQIDPIVLKVERLLLKFRASFVALAQGGVELDQDALTAYVDAAGQFVEIRGACAADSTACGRLNRVLEILKTVQGPIQDALGENPEIYEAVQAQFAE
ncbi:MAG: DUF4215 domain-containing protein [Candidatus Peribacter sp.]|nr:DUF4215 domain-containing protein [Candidatus Peribacter sp.]